MDIYELEKLAKQQDTLASRNQHKIKLPKFFGRSDRESPTSTATHSFHTRGSFFRKKPNQIDPFNVYGRVV